MFSSVKNINELNQKKNDYIHNLELQVEINKTKNRKYKDSYEFYDNTFKLPTTGPTNSIGTQTDSITTQTQTHTSNNNSTQPPNRPIMSDSSTDTGFFQEEDNENQNRLLRNHQDAINHSNNIIFQQNQEIIELRDQMNRMTDQFNHEYHSAETQFNQLIHEHNLSIHQIQLLHKDFDLGRQLYLNLQQAHNTLQDDYLNLHQVSHSEFNDLRRYYDNLKHDYSIGEELYNTLQYAYKALQEDSNTSSVNYEKIIDQLKEVNANQTAMILEQQSQMMKNTISDTAAKNTRSSNNTVEVLRKFLIEKGIEKASAGTTRGSLSKKIQFVIKDGKLYKRQNSKSDINLEDNTEESRKALIGLDPIFTIIGIKYKLNPGTNITKNESYKAEADALRVGGKPLTHEEGEQLRKITAPKNDLDYPMSESTPKRDRTTSLYNNFSPQLETKKKIIKGSGLRAPRLRGAGHTSINVKYKELGGCLINLKALHGGKLSLRHGSNIKQMHGRVIDLSDELQDVVKTLVYDGKIDKELYNELTMSDKKIFDELLNKSSLVYNEKKWDDPKEVLLEEYNKLVGEIGIGNDNPEIKKRLRKVITSMYSCGLINEKKFKNIIEQLI